jgi:limonene-1,2-epoxide hydrolase
VSLAFRAAVEARDIDAMAEALSPDVKFHSPMAHTPFEGREIVRELFEALFDTFEDFHYTDELEAADGTHALVFRAHVGDKQLQGLDLMRVGEDGLIHEFTVMIRPASGLMALGQALAPKVEGLKQ